MMMRTFAICMALIALPALTWAEAGSAAADCEGQQQCTEYFMDGDDVEAQVQTPREDLLSTTNTFRRVPLIHPRADFVDHLLESVENL
jgi:hypothetical protein